MSERVAGLRLGVRYRIEEIVAHDSRMQLLDELVSYGDDHIVVAVCIRESSEFFVPSQGVPSYVGIEYMAQAVGAFSGIIDVQAGRKPHIGLLLGSRRYRCSEQHFAAGARLLVTANLQMRDESNLVAFDCTIHSEGMEIARADLKAIRPDDVHSLVDAQRYSE